MRHSEWRPSVHISPAGDGPGQFHLLLGSSLRDICDFIEEKEGLIK